MNNLSQNISNEFISVSGEMAQLTREKDWSKTPVGDIDSWQQSLRTLIGIVLNSRFPMFLFWGPELICFYNDAYRPSLGKTGKHPSILGMRAEEAWIEIWSIIKPLIDQVLSGGGATWSEDQLIPIFRNGKIEDVYWTFGYSPVNDDTRKIAGVLVTCTETTEKVVTKQKLEESERRLRSLILQAPVSIGIFRGKDFVTEMANARALQMWGRTEEEVIDKPILEAMPELKSQGISEILEGVYNTGKIYTAAELPIQLMRNGKLEKAYMNFSYEPLYNSAGTINGVMAVGSEVTEQVASHKLVEESGKKFQLLADFMPQHIWTADPQGNLNYFNQSVFDYSGLTLEQINKDGWLQIVHPDDRERNIKEWMEAVRTGKDFLFEHRFRRHDGEYRWQLSRAIPQRDDNGNIQMWVGTSTDIQEQKIFLDELEKQVKERTVELVQLNESLKKSEERYHLMVEEVQDYAILYLNREGIVENWNTGAEKIKGYKAVEIIGKSFSNFYSEGDRENKLPQKLLKMAAEQGKAVQQGWRVRKDGTLFWASVVITAVHNEKKELIGFSKVTHDLTAKKEADDALKDKKLELEQKNRDLEKMNKELQSFAYISSHDLQEPLRKIQTFASRITEKEKDNLSENGKDLFNRMQASAERMQSLIDDLLAYSRTHTLERDFQIINLGIVLEKVIQDLNEEIQQKNATIDNLGLCEVNIIPFQFRQLFYNLISNSLKFSSPERSLHILIKSEIGKGSKFDNRNLQSDLNYCHISVADNGIGYESQYNEKIFELFQRLHGRNEYRGTGIGLAIVKRIVENHNGIITANGNPGKGAAFHIYLPAPGN
ncbi:MAG: PAS domain S-box protein [Bacteroidota bacterium]